MHLTRTFKSSPHCVASPDGQSLATLFATHITIRSVDSLETLHTITLPAGVSGPVYGFQWSPSASRLLVAFLDQVHVVSAVNDDFRASIRTASTGTKPTLVSFGATDSTICICHQFGLKFTIADLLTRKSVEVNNPKFHHPAAAARGLSFRPDTAHLALMTRTAGKDVISIHHPDSHEVQRSWHPDTVDAQGLAWTPDGRWLVVCESDSQSHKVLFYTADGHLFKTWPGALGLGVDEKDLELGAGVKFCEISQTATCAAIGDHSRFVYILDLALMAVVVKLHHPTQIDPLDTLQIWQEQAKPVPIAAEDSIFTRAIHPVSAPQSSTQALNAEPKTGCAMAVFDASTALLATKLEDSASTLWIWDLASSELRGVLIFHNNISSFSWHPSIRELLMITCEGDDHAGLVFTWDPLSEGPQLHDYRSRLPESRLSGKPLGRWIKWFDEVPVLLLGDYKHSMMACLSVPDQDTVIRKPRWTDPTASINRSVEGSSLLISADDTFGDNASGVDFSAVDDTFAFRRP